MKTKPAAPALCAPFMLALPLLAAGCAQDNSPQAVCDRVAHDDPKVRLLTVQEISSPWNLNNMPPQVNAALAQARLRCLRARGVVPPGGVEAKQPEPLEHTLW